MKKRKDSRAVRIGMRKELRKLRASMSKVLGPLTKYERIFFNISANQALAKLEAAPATDALYEILAHRCEREIVNAEITYKFHDAIPSQFVDFFDSQHPEWQRAISSMSEGLIIPEGHITPKAVNSLEHLIDARFDGDKSLAPQIERFNERALKLLRVRGPVN